MKAKLLEVRDAATFIPVLAVQLGSEYEAERYLAGRAGYGRTAEAQREYVILSKLDGSGIATQGPHHWPSSTRTMTVAHQYIIDHFDDLAPGAVVDVEFILGIRDTPKQSEQLDEAKYPSMVPLNFGKNA